MRFCSPSGVLLTIVSTFTLASALSSPLKSESKNEHQPTVAVIGCGPAGMFFLNALALRRRTLEQMGNAEGLARLPASVTCFEKTSSLGGVWRSSSRRGSADLKNGTSSQESEEVGMYEALWTNGNSHMLEFSDYTFEEHFGRQVELPTFLPRQFLLEYMIARVTNSDPNFEDNIIFNSAVVSVTYDEMQAKFEVKHRDEVTGEEATSYFDKCIWAAGENGSPYIPKKTKEILDDGGYLGLTVHSSEVDSIDLRRAVEGKRVLMIGAALSAEDLTLQAIKLGAERVYIQSRSGEGHVDYVSAWPMDKVEVLQKVVLTEVIQGGRGIRFKQAKLDFKTDDYAIKDGGNTIDVEDVAIVIYCTGYNSNMGMLDESLQRTYADGWRSYSGIPKDWKMKTNPISQEIGEVKPSEIIDRLWLSHSAKFYRGLLISNPNFMFIMEHSSHPLFEIDTIAWLCMGYITGDIEIPSRDEMELRNAQDIIAAMDVPNLRYLADANFKDSLERLPEDHWYNNPLHPRTLAMQRQYYDHDLRRIARNMRDAGHPFDIGNYDQLNEKGAALVETLISDSTCRIKFSMKEEGSPDSERTTFRDVVDLGKSVHTGDKAVRLRKLWLDLADDEYSDLLGYKGGHQKKVNPLIGKSEEDLFSDSEIKMVDTIDCILS